MEEVERRGGERRVERERERERQREGSTFSAYLIFEEPLPFIYL